MVRRFRLISGLTLFSYVLLHLINHSVGIYSLDAMDAARSIFQAPFANIVGQIALYGAFAVHIGLAMQSLYTRRTFRSMQRVEIIQLIFGLSIPPLLVLHILGTRVIGVVYGTYPSYPWLLAIYFEYDILVGIRQMAVLLIAWVHGCIGLYYWLSVKEFYGRYSKLLLLGAILLPFSAYIGAWSAGREVAALSQDPGYVDTMFQKVNPPPWEAVELLQRVEYTFLAGYAALIVFVLLVRQCRLVIERRRGLVNLVYDRGPEVYVPEGMTILEASRLHKIPHASVCGGRGRCSTCRVKVLSGLEHIAPPSSAELSVLSRINAAPDIRLACQVRPPISRVRIARLLPPTATASDGFARPGYLQGEEIEIVILFADIRNFTTLSENKLPYDVVFLLNRYSDVMGRSVEEAGGYLDKFIGDGVMALFGVGLSDKEKAAAQALEAVRLIERRIADLNESLSDELENPLRVGIGIHVGPAIVGEMGFGRSVQMTAIGDTVNTASRIEQLTKEFGVSVAVSREFADLCALTSDCYTEQEVEIRGRNEPMRVCSIPDPSLLSNRQEDGAGSEAKA